MNNKIKTIAFLLLASTATQAYSVCPPFSWCMRKPAKPAPSKEDLLLERIRGIELTTIKLDGENVKISDLQEAMGKINNLSADDLHELETTDSNSLTLLFDISRGQPVLAHKSLSVKARRFVSINKRSGPCILLRNGMIINGQRFGKFDRKYKPLAKESEISPVEIIKLLDSEDSEIESDELAFLESILTIKNGKIARTFPWVCDIPYEQDEEEEADSASSSSSSSSSSSGKESGDDKAESSSLEESSSEEEEALALLPTPPPASPIAQPADTPPSP